MTASEDGGSSRAATAEEVGLLLLAGEFGALLGIQESIHVDFKRDPYRLDDPKERFELAKDVAALANAGGGLIVIGVKTTRDPLVRVDVAAEVNAISFELIDADRHRKVIEDRVIPHLGGTQVQLHPSSGDASMGLASIVVQAPPPSSFPVIVQKPLDAGEKTPGWLVGLPIRSLDGTAPQSASEVHRMMSVGRQLDDPIAAILEELARVRDAVVSLAFAASGGEEASGGDSLRSQIETVLQDVLPTARLSQTRKRNEHLALLEREFSTDASGIPWIALSASPDEPVHVESITRRDGVRQLLEHPDSLRHAGWNLTTYGDASIRPGPALVLTSGERLGLLLAHDGSLVVLMSCRDFLGHGTWREDSRAILNSIAIVEICLEFARLYAAILTSAASPMPNGITLGAHMRNAYFDAERGLTLKLPKGRPGTLTYGMDVHQPRESDADREFHASKDDIADPEVVGFRLAAAVYNLFDLTDDDVPFTDPEHTRIDSQQLLDL